MTPWFEDEPFVRTWVDLLEMGVWPELTADMWDKPRIRLRGLSDLPEDMRRRAVDMARPYKRRWLEAWGPDHA